MSSSLQHFRITLAFVGYISILPTIVGAQPAFVYLTQWGSYGSAIGQFQHPSDVATDAAGNVYVMDQYNLRVQKFTDAGAYLTQWGTGDGQFGTPVAVATESQAHS